MARGLRGASMLWDRYGCGPRAGTEGQPCSQEVTPSSHGSTGVVPRPSGAAPPAVPSRPGRSLAGAHSEAAPSAGGRGKLREAPPEGGGGRRHVFCSPDPAQGRLPRRRRELCAAAGGVRGCGGPGESQAGPAGIPSAPVGPRGTAAAPRRAAAPGQQVPCSNGGRAGVNSSRARGRCVSRRAPAPAGVIWPRGGGRCRRRPPPRRAADGGVQRSPAPLWGAGRETRFPRSSGKWSSSHRAALGVGETPRKCPRLLRRCFFHVNNGRECVGRSSFFQFIAFLYGIQISEFSFVLFSSDNANWVFIFNSAQPCRDVNGKGVAFGDFRWLDTSCLIFLFNEYFVFSVSHKE